MNINLFYLTNMDPLELTQFITQCFLPPEEYSKMSYSLFNYGDKCTVLLLLSTETYLIEIFIFDALNADPLKNAPSTYYAINYMTFFIKHVTDNEIWYREDRISLLNQIFNSSAFFTIPIERLDHFFYVAHNYGSIKGNRQIIRFGLYYPNYKQNHFVKCHIKRWFVSNSTDIINFKLLFFNSQLKRLREESKKLSEENAATSISGSIFITRFINADTLETSLLNNLSGNKTNWFYKFPGEKDLLDLILFENFRTSVYFFNEWVFLIYPNPKVMKELKPLRENNNFKDIIRESFQQEFLSVEPLDITNSSRNDFNEWEKKVKKISVQKAWEHWKLEDKKNNLFEIEIIEVDDDENGVSIKNVQYYADHENYEQLNNNLNDMFIRLILNGKSNNLKHLTYGDLNNDNDDDDNFSLLLSSIDLDTEPV